MSDHLITRVWCRECEDVERLRDALREEGRPIWAWDEHVTVTKISQPELTQLVERLGIQGWHASEVA